VLFDKLKSGALTLESTFPVSEKAWKKGGSKMFVKVNTDVSVEDLIRGIIVQSGNDACIVVAEALGGSEEAFAKLMNDKAAQIGLSGSHFANATGWPDERHMMTPADLATLTHRLIHDFPDYYPYFAEKEFTYSGITQPNRNRLLGQGVGVDGLKTGHTEAAGYGISISAIDEASGRRVNVVVNGLESDADRISEARRLAEYGLREFEAHSLGQAGVQVAELPVWMGAQEAVSLGLAQPIAVALPRDTSSLRFRMTAETSPLAAPISQGQTVATLMVEHDGQLLRAVPLIALSEVPEASLWRRFWLNLAQMI
jgi:D-alanyl-D-alanine carboxypeptidase (penicillin-binding protein 5/6)